MLDFNNNSNNNNRKLNLAGPNADALRTLLSKVILSMSTDVQRAYQEMRELFGADLDHYLQRREKPSLPLPHS